MKHVKQTRLLVIGAGPAGYTAAIYAARASLEPVLVAGLQPGGQLMITTDVENYPGFADVIQGPWLMEQMEAQARHVGTEIVHDIVTEVDFSARPFRCTLDSGNRPRPPTRAPAFRPAPPAMGFSSAAGKWPWSAVATRRWRKRYTSRTMPRT
jgi:hypothetical protein